MQTVKTFEIEIAAIQNIERSGFGDQIVEGVDVVDFPLGNLNKRRNISAKIEQGMEFDCGFVFSESSPREKRQTQIDGRGVESVNRLIQFDSEGLVGIQTSSRVNQHVRQVGPDFPVANFVGMGDVVAGNSTADTHMIESGVHRPKTGFDIAQTFSITQLSEAHHQKLIEARKRFDLLITLRKI